MKKLFISCILILSLSAIFFTNVNCSGCKNKLKHVKSQAMGLNRKITLYSADGNIIRTWEGKFTLEDRGGTCYFIINNKAITISGTFVVEEL